MDVKELETNDLWWKGPDLQNMAVATPVSLRVSSTVTDQCFTNELKPMSKVTLKFIKNCKTGVKQTLPLTLEEYDLAEIFLIKHFQAGYFSAKMASLKRESSVPQSNMLHGRKKGSILQWYNTLKEGDVTSLAQFTDGSLFYDIVTSLNFTYFSKENAKAESAATDSMEPMDVSVEPINTINEETVETGQSVSQSAVNDSLEVGENGNIDSKKKYDSLKKCIDDIFQIESTSLINYLECLKGNELELAKVAIFLLTALVQNLLSTDRESTTPLTQLDSQVQEDIQEFLSFVLTDRSQNDGPIKKSEFHKLLSRSAGTPHRRQHSRSSGSTDHSESSDGGKKTSKRRDRASSIVYEDNQDSPVKTLLESPKFQQKVAMYRKESELKKLRNALYMEENKVLDLVAEKNILNDKLEKKNKEVESLKNDFRKYREEAEDSECFKLKEGKRLVEEIECLKKVNHSLKEENNKLKKENETYDNKVEELEMKLAEKKVPDCNDKSHVTLSEELTIKDDELAHLKADVKMLEKKLQTLEETSYERNELSSRVPKVLSNVTNVNEVTTALLDKKEQEIKSLWTKLWDETEKTKNFEALLEFSEKEKMDQNEEINRNINLISVLESNQAYYQQQLDFFKENCTCLKNSRTNSNNSKEQEVGDLQLSSTNSKEFLSEAENPTSIAEELDLLQSNLSNDSNLNLKNPIEFDSSMRVPNSDFVLLQKMIQNLVGLIWKKNYGLDVHALVKLEKELGDTQCIQQIILAVNFIVDALKRAKSNTPDKKSSDPQLKALTLKKKGLEAENKSLKQELNDVNKCLQVKEVELQIVKNECEKLQSLKKDLNEKIDKVSKEAEEIFKKYEGAKKCIEKKEIELRKLMKLYMTLTKSAEPDKSRSSCDECKKLQQKIRELQSECSDKEQVIREFKLAKRNLEGRIKNYVQQVKQLHHEKEELQFKHQRDVSYSCGTLSDRQKVMLCYYEKAFAELDEKAKALKKTKKAQSWSTIPSVSTNTYTMCGEKNSTVENSISIANQSIRSSFFQVANEDDFLNHSSLADIHNGGDTKDSNDVNRLKELRRRNTFCLPHLQSSYPLEIQNMTPSEKKYYEPSRHLMNISLVTDKMELNRQQEEETDSDNSRKPFILSKRKIPDNDNVTNASKKIFRPSSLSTKVKSLSSKSATSLKQGTSLLKKGTIRTPSSTRHFNNKPHNNSKKY
ncbi:uncharacterized protein TNIN_252561 [Trichonephila inaurata madagascariensis]|uniref:Uncharacterized protein n=1 Tax=Trichonephila inaurata madagascariensis TaxID=2747483 RepID=A0A8X6YF56_9ARAC|nr:uncharacterized protein TNIN_252561 [Trichonephila inaurata madagascariensis]